MPPSIFILQEWKKQQQVFLKNLEILRLHNQTAATHDLRVAVKKLRSYLKLLSILSPKNDYKAKFEKTEYLFSILGKLRDIEIGLSLLEAFEKENKIVYTAFKNQLQFARQQALARVKTAVKNDDTKELANLTEQIEAGLKNIDASKITDKTKTIVEKELATVIRLAVHLSRQAHRIRKLLKDIFYWASPGAKDAPLLDTETIKKCKKIMELLGDWQDHEMLLRKLKHFRKDFVPDANHEYTLLKILERNIEDKMEAILKDADKSIRNISA